MLVVVAIIGVLAAVAIPAYNNYRDNAAQSEGSEIMKAVQACLTVATTNANINSLIKVFETKYLLTIFFLKEKTILAHLKQPIWKN